MLQVPTPNAHSHDYLQSSSMQHNTPFDAVRGNVTCFCFGFVKRTGCAKRIVTQRQKVESHPCKDTYTHARMHTRTDARVSGKANIVPHGQELAQLLCAGHLWFSHGFVRAVVCNASFRHAVRAMDMHRRVRCTMAGKGCVFVEG